MLEALIPYAGLVVVASPLALIAANGLPQVAGFRLSEQRVSQFTQAAVVLGLFPLLTIFTYMLASGQRFVPVDLGDWIAIEDAHFHFHLKLIFDRLSIPFTLLVYILCGVVGAFARRYLHRENGYHRFFFLYSMFFAGMVISSVAGTIETLFFGWELVGLSSALLVAYFHERIAPVRNGLRVWIVYRLADAAFMLAALLMHHLTGEGDFSSFVGSEPWPAGIAHIAPLQAFLIGLLLLLAACGKSALPPFSGWLPRAMEGPTPSSAIFYGALSVHLGAYMLLRTSPILDASVPLQIVVSMIGLATAIIGAMISRVQTDVKSALAYASLTQVGIIIFEIGLGLYYLALIHILGHACLRTLQLLRAPSLMKDYHALENAIGSRLSNNQGMIARFLPERVRLAAYRFSLERGYFDIILDEFIARPVLAIFRWSDRQERRWTDWLAGEPSRESDFVPNHPEDLELDRRATWDEHMAKLRLFGATATSTIQAPISSPKFAEHATSPETSLKVDATEDRNVNHG